MRLLLCIFLTWLLASCTTLQQRSANNNDPYQQYRSVPTQKIWEPGPPHELYYISEDNVSVKLVPYPPRGTTAFIADVSDRRFAVRAEFQGSCEPFMQVTIHLTDPRLFDIASYNQSRVGKDLPIESALIAMRDVLQVQCPQLAGLRITAPFVPTSPPSKYKGHYLESNNWVIGDGVPAGGFGEGYRIKIAVTTGVPGRDGPAIIHDAKCEKVVSLPIKRHFYNDMQRAFPQKISIYDLKALAASATKQYTNECPDVEIIRFPLDGDILPGNLMCTQPDECLVARKSDQWKVTNKSITYR